MARHKDFPVEKRNPEEKGPTFGLGDQVLRCLPALPAGAFMDLPDSLVDQVVVAGHFVRSCLLPEDEAAFDAVLADKSLRIQPFDLMPTLRWLLNEAWLPEDEPDEPAPEPA